MKNTAFILVSLLTLGIALHLFHGNPSVNAPIKKNKISGAYKAMNFMGARQTFPAGTIPANAYTKGWQVKQKMRAHSETFRDATEPWETMGPLNKAGRTLAIAFNPQHPSTMYAGSASGGLWRSYTAGVGAKAWKRVDTGFPVLAVSCITFAPGDSTTMFIGTGEVYNHDEAGTGAAYRRTRGSWGIGILKSTDGGNTWSKSLDWSLDENHGVWAIEIAPDDPNIIYAATTDGTYKSIDNGGTWQKIHDVVMATDLLIYPDDHDKVLVACGNLSSPGGGIYRTTDGGTNWTAITENIPSFRGKIQFGAAPSDADIVYASIGDGFSLNEGASWLLRSDDFGEHWILKNQTDYSKWQGWYAHDVAVRPDNPDEIIVIGIEIWKSTNGGDTLTQIAYGGIGDPNPPIGGPDGPYYFVHSDAHQIIYHPTNPDIFYIADDGGIHRSIDNGENFAGCTGSYQTMQFYNGFTNSHQNDTFCLGGLQDNGTIAWNGDKTWQVVFGGDGSWAAINPDDDNTYYVSWYELNIYRITTLPEAYDYMEIPKKGFPLFIAPFVVAPSNPSVLYAGSAGIAKTTDSGDTWALTNGSAPLQENYPGVLSMAISYQNENTVYAATAPKPGTPAKVFKTTDGDTWTDITGDLPNRYPMDIAVNPVNDDIAFITFAGFGSGHVFKTTDGGDTWIDISGDLPDVPTNAVVVDPLFPDNIYVGNDLGVFVSPDGGDTWETYQEGLPEVTMVFDLTIAPVSRKLRVATHGNGAYQRDLIEEVVGVKETASTDNDLRVYPNPATTDIHINYNLKKRQTVTISLLDALGKRIRSIQKPTVQERGNHALHLPVNDLPGGLYLVQMTTQTGEVTRKIVISGL